MQVGRVSLALVIAVALGSGCSSGSSKPGTTTTSASTTSSSAPASTSSTTVPAAAFSSAVWPWVASSLRFRDPVAATRSFATRYLHMTAPVVGAFQQGDSRSGEVSIRPKANGPVTTAIVRQLGNDGTWWVIGAATDNIRISTPAALDTITSPVALRGTSTAFEATVNVSIRQDNVNAALAESHVMGGSNGQMGPFDATVSFPPPASRAGSIVMYTISAEDGHVAEATVVRVGFGST